MPNEYRRNSIKALLVALVLLLATGAWAQGTVLYDFTGGKDGANPRSRLLWIDGNLYGTTTAGGASGNGEVFEITQGHRGWIVEVLYSFSGGADGSQPAAGLVQDKKGSFYGTLASGGAHGHGAIFKLTTDGKGWTKQLIYSFSGSNDGGQPVGSLIFDKAGNLYGTTPVDGKYGQGVAFQLTPTTKGNWKEHVLHAFGHNNDGQGPGGALVFDKTGNLYGLTVAGGTAGNGTAFILQPQAGGSWKEKVLHNFQGGTDGANPATSDLMVQGSNLYGTTTSGGSLGAGTVFKMTRTQAGKWKERVLYAFQGGADGGNPYAGLLRDSKGNLFGTTATGAQGAGGVVFELSPASGGKWTENVLYTFDNAGNGSYAGLTADESANLYGTTEFGGPQSAGSVFQVAVK